MDAKTEAQHRRNIANAFDVLADAFKPLDAHTAEGYQNSATVNRSLADKLDPPQPEWQDGDLVRDRFGTLWEYELEVWHCHHANRGTEALTNTYGPLTRVLTYDPATQHIADPAKQEVVISLDGINRDALDQWAKWAACEPAEEVCIRAAKAAREQLGEVQ